MSERKRYGNLNRTFDVAERIQNLESVRGLGSVYITAANIIVGSRSEAYVRVRFVKVDELVDEDGNDTELPIAEANPTPNKFAELIQRRKDKAVVVGATKAAMIETLVDHIYTYPHPQIVPAVAFTVGDETRAGILSVGLESYGCYEDMHTAALREGKKDFGAGIGFLLPRQRRLIVPRSNEVIKSHVDIYDELPENYPGTPLP
jgi:hypothetical protein